MKNKPSTPRLMISWEEKKKERDTVVRMRGFAAKRGGGKEDYWEVGRKEKDALTSRI